jgi:hypothetical protein
MEVAMKVSRQVSITGSTFYLNATALIKNLKPGDALTLKREPELKYDKNAVAVYLPSKFGDKQLGYVPRGLAADLAPIMDAGTAITACRARTALEGVMLLTWDDGKPEPAPEAA